MFCKTCSKDGCLSCPFGRWGQFCENVENFKANHTNLTEAPEEKMESFTQEIIERQTKFHNFPANTADNISIVNIPPEKLPKSKKHKNKFRKNKNDRNPKAVTDGTMAVMNGNDEQSNIEKDKENEHYADVFDSNLNPEVSYSILNKTEKFTSKQKSKETLTVLHDSLTDNDKDDFLPIIIQNENEARITDEETIHANDSLTYRIDSVNSSKSDFHNYSSENIDSSKNKELKEDSFIENNGNSYENLNDSSRNWNLAFEFPEMHENANIEKSRKLNISFRSQKFPFESSELHENVSIEEKEYKTNIMENLPSEQTSQTEKGQTLFEEEIDLKEAKFLYPLISFRKISFNFPESVNKSIHGTNQSKNSELNPIEYRSAFVLDNRDPKKDHFTQKIYNEQSDVYKMVTKLPKIQNPLNISTFKVKIIDLGEKEDAEYRNASKEHTEVDKIIKTSEISEDQIFENNSKEFEILRSPLEVNIFKITFIGEESDSPIKNPNPNLAENRMIENGEKKNASQTSQINTSEPDESIATDSETAAPLSVNVSKIRIWKENVSSSSDETSQNNTVKSVEDNRRKITKERTANYKRNATNKPYDELQYDIDALQRMIMQSSDFKRNKIGKSNDEQLYSSKSFSKYNIPENHILMPLYFPEMYNTEQYRSSFSNNVDLQKLCDLYPNYSPCFRIRMLAPRSPYFDMFGPLSQTHSKPHHPKSSQNGNYIHHYPQMIYYDSEGNINAHSYVEKEQNYLKDMRTLALLKKYLQSKNARSFSSLPLKNSQPFDITPEQEESLQLLVYGWNNKNQSKQRFDSALLSGLINYFLSLIAPKYNGTEITQTDILRQQEWYENKPARSFAASQVMDLPLDVYQHRSFTDTYGQDYNSPYGSFKTREDNTEYFNTRMLDNQERVHFTDTDPEQNKHKYESIRISLNIPSELEYLGVLPLTHNKTAGSIHIKVMHPMFGQFSFKNETNIREGDSFESAEDTLFESCARCVISESVYQPVEGGEKPGKSLPTIFRALIIEEEGLLLGNQSDSEKPDKSRSKRAIYNYGTHEWCPIERRMLNGDLDCTIWSYQKVCTLICHPGYTCEYQTFRCLRKTNIWTPKLCPCKPIIQYNSFTYRHGNDSLSELLFLPEGNEHGKNMRNHNDSSINRSSLFDTMERNDRVEEYPHYEPAAQQRENDRQDNSTFHNIQSYPGDMTATRKHSSKFDNIRSFPGYEELKEENKTAFAYNQGFPDGMNTDRKENFKFDNNGFPAEVAVDRKINSKSGKTREFPQIMVVDGKDVDKKLLSEDEISDAERMFDTYEQTRSIKEESSDKRHKYVQKMPLMEKNNQNTDKIYSYFDKENPETGNVDFW
ncbi:hypothetical protein HNY73_017201 [Argiope bruennichi]|uniref:Uncharacterized protein n=1 Tax=Argiope bruennichi TaxID=94029 RepID=A0A8T0EKT7_ARGBR|nr:hypothetical protein HNY73_017201 [Argiope bruennichi]